MPIIEGNYIEGAGTRLRVQRLTITSSEVLALNSTPKVVVPAPGAERALIFFGALIRKSAGTAYSGITAGMDIAVKYTGAAGLEVSQCETTGFLDQSTNQIRWVSARSPATGTADFTPVANAPLVFHLLAAGISSGTSPLDVEIYYIVVDTDPST